MQRFFDFALAGLAILILSPLLVLIALILRFSGEGEVLFAQLRVGRGGEVFRLYKFATMLKNSPSMGTGTVTVRNDPRILPIGHFLRKTKINELPQLLNILKGDMSLIGPRPQAQRCFSAFPETARCQIVRVRPGLSGIGSIVFRNEEEMLYGHQDPGRFYDEVIMPYKGALEVWFVKNHNFCIYCRLIILTLWVVIFPRTRAVWSMFVGLPQPDPELAPFLC